MYRCEQAGKQPRTTKLWRNRDAIRTRARARSVERPEEGKTTHAVRAHMWLAHGCVMYSIHNAHRPPAVCALGVGLDTARARERERERLRRGCRRGAKTGNAGRHCATRLCGCAFVLLARVFICQLTWFWRAAACCLPPAAWCWLASGIQCTHTSCVMCGTGFAG